MEDTIEITLQEHFNILKHSNMDQLHSDMKKDNQNMRNRKGAVTINREEWRMKKVPLMAQARSGRKQGRVHAGNESRHISITFKRWNLSMKNQTCIDFHACT